jgi:hypothetical protein
MRISIECQLVALCIRVTTLTLLLLVAGHGPGPMPRQYGPPKMVVVDAGGIRTPGLHAIAAGRNSLGFAST